MHGFLNLLVATAVAQRDPSVAADILCAILDESSPAAFTMDEDSGLAWKDQRLSHDDLVTARAQGLRVRGLVLVPGAGRRPASIGLVAEARSRSPYTEPSARSRKPAAGSRKPEAGSR